jgi:aspartyl-tRNA(Asn)/glutamyl-tRNA(Gln) amidotransferase subunit B
VSETKAKNVSEISATKLKIGFEIHAQVNTKQKLYCDCPTDYQKAEPNRNICPVCIGLPGNKPMPINKEALDTCIEIALMLVSDLVRQDNIYVQRKHYSYPDLPNGYQKTSTPVARGGSFLGVGIAEIHLEDDPGRYELSKGMVDYNRCGVPLIEIVTNPDIHSVDEARNFWNEMVKMLVHTGRIRSEPGTIRSDTNISMGGERVEIKNINSSAGVSHALQYEIKRQLKASRRGIEVRRETRGFLEDKMITTSLRTKETFADYRYIPDPDIPPIVINDEMVDAVKKGVKESPIQKRTRLVAQYKINEEQAKVLASDPELSKMFEDVSKKIEPSLAAGWLVKSVKRHLNEKSISLHDTHLSSDDMIDLLGAAGEKRVTVFAAEGILKKVIDGEHHVNYYLGKASPAVGEERLLGIIDDVVANNEQSVSDYKSGNKKALNYLVGEVMKENKGAVDPKLAIELLKKRIEEPEKT